MLLQSRPRRRFASPHGALNFCAFCRTFRADAVPRRIGDAIITVGVCDPCVVTLPTIQRKEA